MYSVMSFAFAVLATDWIRVVPSKVMPLEHRRAESFQPFSRADVVDEVEHLAAGLHREAFAGEDEDLLALDAGQRGHAAR